MKFRGCLSPLSLISIFLAIIIIGSIWIAVVGPARQQNVNNLNETATASPFAPALSVTAQIEQIQGTAGAQLNITAATRTAIANQTATPLAMETSTSVAQTSIAQTTIIAATETQDSIDTQVAAAEAVILTTANAEASLTATNQFMLNETATMNAIQTQNQETASANTQTAFANMTATQAAVNANITATSIAVNDATQAVFSTATADAARCFVSVDTQLYRNPFPVEIEDNIIGPISGQVEITGYLNDNSWFFIEAEGAMGWISGDVVQFNCDIRYLADNSNYRDVGDLVFEETFGNNINRWPSENLSGQTGTININSRNQVISPEGIQIDLEGSYTIDFTVRLTAGGNTSEAGILLESPDNRYYTVGLSRTNGCSVQFSQGNNYRPNIDPDFGNNEQPTNDCNIGDLHWIRIQRRTDNNVGNILISIDGEVILSQPDSLINFPINQVSLYVDSKASFDSVASFDHLFIWND